MKPFDLEAAKKGAKVCLGDGTPARIIAFDAKGKYPIVTLIEAGDIETVVRFTTQGRRNANTGVDNSHIDLFMASVKHKGWVNVYRRSPTSTSFTCGALFQTKEEAKQQLSADDKTYIQTVSIEWEV